MNKVNSFIFNVIREGFKAILSASLLVTTTSLPTKAWGLSLTLSGSSSSQIPLSAAPMSPIPNPTGHTQQLDPISTIAENDIPSDLMKFYKPIFSSLSSKVTCALYYGTPGLCNSPPKENEIFEIEKKISEWSKYIQEKLTNPHDELASNIKYNALRSGITIYLYFCAVYLIELLRTSIDIPLDPDKWREKYSLFIDINDLKSSEVLNFLVQVNREATNNQRVFTSYERKNGKGQLVLSLPLKLVPDIIYFKEGHRFSKEKNGANLALLVAIDFLLMNQFTVRRLLKNSNLKVDIPPSLLARFPSLRFKQSSMEIEFKLAKDDFIRGKAMEMILPIMKELHSTEMYFVTNQFLVDSYLIKSENIGDNYSTTIQKKLHDNDESSLSTVQNIKSLIALMPIEAGTPTDFLESLSGSIAHAKAIAMREKYFSPAELRNSNVQPEYQNEYINEIDQVIRLRAEKYKEEIKPLLQKYSNKLSSMYLAMDTREVTKLSTSITNTARIISSLAKEKNQPVNFKTLVNLRKEQIEKIVSNKNFFSPNIDFEKDPLIVNLKTLLNFESYEMAASFHQEVLIYLLSQFQPKQQKPGLSPMMSSPPVALDISDPENIMRWLQFVEVGKNMENPAKRTDKVSLMAQDKINEKNVMIKATQLENNLKKWIRIGDLLVLFNGRFKDKFRNPIKKSIIEHNEWTGDNLGWMMAWNQDDAPTAIDTKIPTVADLNLSDDEYAVYQKNLKQVLLKPYPFLNLKMSPGDSSWNTTSERTGEYTIYDWLIFEPSSPEAIIQIGLKKVDENISKQLLALTGEKDFLTSWRDKALGLINQITTSSPQEVTSIEHAVLIHDSLLLQKEISRHPALLSSYGKLQSKLIEKSDPYKTWESSNKYIDKMFMTMMAWQALKIFKHFLFGNYIGSIMGIIGSLFDFPGLKLFSHTVNTLFAISITTKWIDSFIVTPFLSEVSRNFSMCLEENNCLITPEEQQTQWDARVKGQKNSFLLELGLLIFGAIAIYTGISFFKKMRIQSLIQRGENLEKLLANIGLGSRSTRLGEPLAIDSTVITDEGLDIATQSLLHTLSNSRRVEPKNVLKSVPDAAPPPNQGSATKPNFATPVRLPPPYSVNFQTLPAQIRRWIQGTPSSSRSDLIFHTEDVLRQWVRRQILRDASAAQKIIDEQVAYFKNFYQRYRHQLSVLGLEHLTFDQLLLIRSIVPELNSLLQMGKITYVEHSIKMGALREIEQELEPILEVLISQKNPTARRFLASALVKLSFTTKQIGELTEKLQQTYGLADFRALILGDSVTTAQQLKGPKMPENNPTQSKSVFVISPDWVKFLNEVF
ncbi:MAG: hypothetical protein K1X29_02755 [Bdellovibrionales bacterium]|nr:hypothetical protein [Bdellovibrionales bacterium]